MLPTLYYYIYTATRPHLLKSKWKYWHHLTHASKLLFHLTFEFGIVIERILVQQSVPKYFFHRFYAGIQEKYSRIAPIAVWPKLGGKGGGWPIKGSQSNFKFKDFWSICQPFPFVGMKFVWYLIVQLFVWFFAIFENLSRSQNCAIFCDWLSFTAAPAILHQQATARQRLAMIFMEITRFNAITTN